MRKVVRITLWVVAAIIALVALFFPDAVSVVASDNTEEQPKAKKGKPEVSPVDNGTGTIEVEHEVM